MYLFLTLCIAALLGLISANIAKEKGYSFGLWWFYGWMLFIVAIIHVNFLPDMNQQSNRSDTIAYTPSSLSSAADELSKYKKMLDEGAITPEEYEHTKKQILGL